MAGPVLRLDGVSKSFGAVRVLDHISLHLCAGERVAVLGGRSTGRTTLAGIVTGRLQPGAGSVLRDGIVGPPVGQAAGLGATGRLERDLGMRAVTWGMARADLTLAVVEALARLPEAARGGLPAERFLAERFDRLPAPVRQTVQHAAAWAVPAALYVADGALRPGDARAAAAVQPLSEAATARAALLWLPQGPGALKREVPFRVLTLADGRLHVSEAEGASRHATARDAPPAAAAPPRPNAFQSRERRLATTPRPDTRLDALHGPRIAARPAGITRDGPAEAGPPSVGVAAQDGQCLIALMRAGAPSRASAAPLPAPGGTGMVPGAKS